MPSSEEGRAANRTGWFLSLLIAATGLALAACSRGPSLSGGPPARLGSSLAAWQATRGSDGNGGYGSTIAVGGQSAAQFTAVATTGAKGSPDGIRYSRPAPAWATPRPRSATPCRRMPARPPHGGGHSPVEVVTASSVSYQSASLASQLGTAVPTPTESNIGARIHELTPHRLGVAQHRHGELGAGEHHAVHPGRALLSSSSASKFACFVRRTVGRSAVGLTRVSTSAQAGKTSRLPGDLPRCWGSRNCTWNHPSAPLR